ncbi:ThiF family adenylyltransferase [Devriesea agamarum]|uniref:ThiF family adenylyltransferase n=1 Tax=Devriesea agamarum TaxID=472569 RepID=UPI000A06E1EE|nr:ThiF family adenylyltransferase [Devriesea agamarum]
MPALDEQPRLMSRPEPVTPAAELSDEERRRYARHLTLPVFGDLGQRRLKNSRVAVVGAGGLGSPVLLYLAAAGVGHLTVIDADKVDDTNLQRQIIHGHDTLGTLKVDSAAARIAAINPLVTVSCIPQVLDSSNALDILAGHDVVIDGTDNFPTRYLVSDACEILDLPLVWGSILAFDGQLAVFWNAGGRGVTYRDVHPTPPPPGSVQNCAEAGVLGMLCGQIGSAMANEAVKILTGIGDVLLERIALYDALGARWTHLDIARNPNRAAVTELVDYQDFCGVPRADGGVGIADVAALVDSGRALVDIRNDDEVAFGMLPGAVHIPMDRLLDDPHAADRLLRERYRIATGLSGAVLYCQGGIRSAAARSRLAEAGFNALTMNGGYSAAQSMLGH